MLNPSCPGTLPHISAVLSLYPVIDPSFETDSYRKRATGYFNTSDRVIFLFPTNG